MMKKTVVIFFILFSQFITVFGQSQDSLILRKIYNESLEHGQAYHYLKTLCKQIGHRLSGSPQADKAVLWAQKAMTDFGADTVFLQDVMVPHWVRGEKENASIISSKNNQSIPLNVLALGGSVGTDGKTLMAKVVEVSSLDELDKLGAAKCAGKIVFINQRMDATKIMTFDAYGPAVAIRWAGAKRAAPLGAVAVIIRSVNPSLDDFPHTGTLHYPDTIKKIPACAISTNDAEKLSAMIKSDSQLKIRLKMNCKQLPDAPSHNVIGEIKGIDANAGYLIVGGHLDSWDTGEGAHDDGAGVVQAMEVLNLLKKAGIKPQHTIRAVAFMNEENGGKGGEYYAKNALQKGEKHIAAIESDCGGFTPRGFFLQGDSLKKEKIRSWKNLFEPYQIHSFNFDGGGADIGHLKNQNTFLLGLLPDTQRYFDIHHSPNDVYENVNRRELQLGAATMAAMIYLIDKYGLE
ncbi:MAG: M20/M25/M40 family metallo-hydrolase [Bacteroidia bacterium]|nr:M20/M25/M40 family metallo-hydrolase [Bacteroidia bacterium]